MNNKTDNKEEKESNLHGEVLILIGLMGTAIFGAILAHSTELSNDVNLTELIAEKAKYILLGLHISVSILGLYFISSCSKSINEKYSIFGNNISSKNIEIGAIYLIFYMAFLITLLNFLFFIDRLFNSTEWGYFIVSTLLMIAMFVIVVKYYANKNFKFFRKVSETDYIRLKEMISTKKMSVSLSDNDKLRYWKYNQIEALYNE